MTLTYTSAAERDTLRTRQRARLFGVADLLMLATSCVALFAIGLAYTGRLRVFDASETQHADVRTVNLNAVSDAAEIEPALTYCSHFYSGRARESLRPSEAESARQTSPLVGCCREPLSSCRPAARSTPSSQEPRHR